MEDRRRQLEELYRAAREQPPERRADFLRVQCGPDHALRREIESLLDRDSQADGALDRPAWEEMETRLDAPLSADQAGDEPMAVGTAIGPYRIAEVLGAGGMGCVYRAHDTRLGRVVAVKVSKTRFSERFEREARAIAALNHPNICQLYDVGPNYLVMEFVDGAPLKTDYGIRRTISIAVQIAEGVAAAHAAGITHRDLKPGNILLTNAGQVKIVDFGLAKVAAPLEPVRRFGKAVAVAIAAAVTAAVAALAIASRPGPPDTSGFRFTPVAVDANDAHHPAWSPDGRSIAYFESAGTSKRIVIRDLYRATPPLPLIEVRYDNSPLSWSPDGERIFYAEPNRGVLSISRAGGQPKVVLAPPRGARKTYDLPVLSPDGGTLALLIVDRSQSGPVTRVAFSSPPGAEPKPVGEALPCCGSSIAWTPDSRRILVSNHSPVGGSIFSVTMDGRRKLLQQIPGAGPFGVELSAIPNSRYFAASRITGDDAFGLALIDGDSGGVQRLLPSHTPITSPSVSRDGSRIAYTSRSVFAQAYEIPLTGGAPRPLASSSLSVFGVAFSPRKNEFAYTRFGQLILHDRNTSEERVLVSGEDLPHALYRQDFLWPAFSRAGDRIIFTCLGCEKDLSLWVVPVSGGMPARVAGNGEGGTVVSWSPDGKQIAYVRQDLNGVSEPVKLQLGTGDKPERIASEPCTPSWSPAGDWILCSGRTAKLISPDGSRVRELSGIFGITAWSNDGKRIYNVRRAEDRVVIEQLDPNTDKRETLTEYALDGPYPIRRFSVSADGKSIGFMAQAGDGDIWILDGFQPPRSLWERLWRRKP